MITYLFIIFYCVNPVDVVISKLHAKKIILKSFSSTSAMHLSCHHEYCIEDIMQWRLHSSKMAGQTSNTCSSLDTTHATEFQTGMDELLMGRAWLLHTTCLTMIGTMLEEGSVGNHWLTNTKNCNYIYTYAFFYFVLLFFCIIYR